jgi:hypothetical protein
MPVFAQHWSIVRRVGSCCWRSSPLAAAVHTCRHRIIAQRCEEWSRWGRGRTRRGLDGRCSMHSKTNCHSHWETIRNQSEKLHNPCKIVWHW